MIPRKVAIVHTSLLTQKDLNQLFNTFLPEVEVINIIDDSLLLELMRKGGITSGITKRVVNYVQMAASTGVDLIFSQCTSVGPAFDIAVQTISTPTLKIDRPMLEEAIHLGQRIGVVGTVNTTMEPSKTFLKQIAVENGRTVEVVDGLVEGALDKLVQTGDRHRYNQMILEKIHTMQAQCEVIVLAQGSMRTLEPELGQFQIPILISPVRAIKRVGEMLGI